jgi:hypothetical protein
MAEQRKCPFCEQVVINDTKVCHLCGHELPAASEGSGTASGSSLWRTGRTFILIVLAALIVLVLVLALRSWLAGPAPAPVGTVLSAVRVLA